MADQAQKTGKRLQISKANTTMVAVVAFASFVAMFSLVASKALWDQRSFQAEVITEKEEARDQLEENIAAVDSLVNSYDVFVGTPENVLGGDPNGVGDTDGDNAKIVLDALPSKYDFPALATSLDKLLSGGNYTANSITGNDDEVNQQEVSAESGPIEMPFQLSATSNYTSLQELLDTMERSIRPINITSLSFSGDDASLQVQVNAKTYYQPAKTLQITTKEVK